ncbi:DUF3397 domain-containing protein [Jeotgalibacillus campisalis]|uniref:DUF3397 domain-containing protein n=1 Tax=Jeotgalibacillus campisalis TaxID=220754 RepID=A0A0C2VUD3_9BACL|nr:DUF3397 domain-containing protein [Jeotgalibacillus campisalis]KIL47618.1 hypothetical protein KR50_17850 [Jeotgalibacillus campisalis]
MTNAIAFVISIFIAMPILVYILLFSSAKWLTKNHRYAVNLAIYGATPFVIGSVYFLFLTIWNVSLLWLILIFMALIGIILAFYIWQKNDDFDWHKLYRGFWRMNFAFFLMIYSFLLAFGILYSVIRSIS